MDVTGDSHAATGNVVNRAVNWLNRPDFALYGLLVISVVLGGGGVGSGFFNLVVQLAALIILVLHRDAVFTFVSDGPRLLVVLVLATLALPLVQLIPLPPGIWGALPGRDLVGQSLDLIGARDDRMALSVDPNRTMLGFIALLPGVAVLALGWRLDPAQARRVCGLLAALGVLSIAMGAVQLATANHAGNLYPGGHPMQLYGTFANHNTAGLFLVIAILMLTGLRSRRAGKPRFRGAGLALAAVFAIGVIVTQSRSSTLLLIVAALFLLAMGRPSASGRAGSTPATGWRRAAALKMLVPLALLIAGGGYVLLENEKVQQTIGRFDDLNDPRLRIWQDSAVVAARYWPVGSGAGTFDEVFQIDESLEHVVPPRAGRAHNDYLEVAIESGLPGLALLACWIVWLGWQARHAATCGDRHMRYAAAAGLACIALQSFLDYPLRNEAMVCVAAVLIALLARKSVVSPS